MNDSATSSAGARRVGVVGGGIMGAGIAEVSARAGIETTLVEVKSEAAEAARSRVERSLNRAIEREKIELAMAERARELLSYATDLDSMADRDLVVEAVVEDREEKKHVFARLAEVVESPDAVLASNTSSIPIVDLAAAAGERAHSVIGLHFFNPVPVLPLVEVIPSLLTDEAITRRARAYVGEQLGKDVIVAPDRAGFTVNALLIPYLLSAIRMFERGLATAEDIDAGMTKGCAHPLGPLALADHIGLDTVLGVSEALYAEHREQLFAPPPLLQRLVAAKMLGRKNGRGLYEYD